MPAFHASVDVWVTQSPESSSYPAAMLRTASALRASGLAVEYVLRAQRADKQFEAARKAGARHIVMVEQAADGTVTFRARIAERGEQVFDTIEALTGWASSTTGIVT